MRRIVRLQVLDTEIEKVYYRSMKTEINQYNHLLTNKKNNRMPEYRIDGVTLSGKAVSGSITADTRGIAKVKAAELSRDKKFKVTGIHERVTFIYRVQKGTDKPIDGEQKAFTRR